MDQDHTQIISSRKKKREMELKLKVAKKRRNPDRIQQEQARYSYCPESHITQSQIAVLSERTPMCDVRLSFWKRTEVLKLSKSRICSPKGACDGKYKNLGPPLLD
uniref:Uncharacterized protein n=1 Tax=Oryza brachyantha TaxID=4533 RepID=J3KXS5_ORYBR